MEEKDGEMRDGKMISLHVKVIIPDSGIILMRLCANFLLKTNSCKGTPWVFCGEVIGTPCFLQLRKKNVVTNCNAQCTFGGF